MATFHVLAGNSHDETNETVQLAGQQVSRSGLSPLLKSRTSLSHSLLQPFGSLFQLPLDFEGKNLKGQTLHHPDFSYTHLNGPPAILCHSFMAEHLEAIASRLEAIASRLEARLEAIASRFTKTFQQGLSPWLLWSCLIPSGHTSSGPRIEKMTGARGTQAGVKRSRYVSTQLNIIATNPLCMEEKCLPSSAGFEYVFHQS